MMTTIIEIGDILVSSEIITEYFSCDYSKCKGCCCIIGDSGAPLEEYECEDIEKSYKVCSKMLKPQNMAIIEKGGFFNIDTDGDIVTPLVGGSGECVYTLFDENENCFCAFERGFISGKTDFRKPISCWLYPIRISKLTSGKTALNLHKWHICADAFKKGREEGVPVFQFLKQPLIHHFGIEFYNALEAVSSNNLLASS